MKLQPMTRARWVELFFGAILPTIVILPVTVLFLCIDMGGGLLISITNPTVEGEYFWGRLLLLLSGIFTVGSFISLWLLILYGVNEINRHPRLRLFVIVTAILGLLIAAFFFIWWGLPNWIDLFVKKDFNARHGFPEISFKNLLNLETWGYILFFEGRFLWLVLLCPIVVGLRYLLLLLKGTK